MQAIKTANTQYGDISYYADDEYIGHALEKYGVYSAAEIDLWRKIIKPGDTVIDVGANIGSLTLPLADMVGEAGLVYAFEPQPENFQLLKSNLAAHDNVKVFADALGAAIGVLLIPRLAELHHANYGRVELGRGAASAGVLPLDSLELADIAFIKIDVEGFEAEVIEGGRQTIARNAPVLYVEVDRPEKREALLNLIRSLGYACYEHLPRIYPDQNVVSRNVLAVPTKRRGEFAAVTADLKLLQAAPAASKWAGICRFGGIGDNLIAASVLRPLHAMGYQIEVISQKPQSSVFENNPFISKLSLKNTAAELPQAGLDWQKWFWARGKEYDRFVNLSHSCENLGALFPVATAYWWPAAFRRKLCGRSYLELAHDIVGVPYQFGPLFFPTEEEKAAALATKSQLRGRKIIGWCITGTRVDKVYPMAALAIARLIRELDVDVIMLGAPPPAADFTFAQQTLAHVKRQNGNEQGLYLALSPNAEQPTWPIRRMLTFVLECDLVIGPDTGPMWAVAMEPMPKIVLHSHASVENICKHWVNTVSLTGAVPCWPCHRLHDGIDTCNETQIEAGMKPEPELQGAACISAIAVDDIIAQAALALGVKNGIRDQDFTTGRQAAE